MNAACGWAAILLGLLSGLALGAGFHAEGWLGGYASWRRRLLRLGHVSLVALGALNVLFADRVADLTLPAAWTQVASTSFLAGAAAMPACCALVAFRPGLRPLFAVPVGALVLAVSLTLVGELP